MRRIHSIIALLALAAGTARAGTISLGIPAYGGTGCPQGTVGITLSPDAKQLAILFDSYSAEAMKSKTVDRKTCNLAIPVHVPQGYSVSIFQIDYRGYNSLPRGASSQLTAEYFLGDKRGPQLSRTFLGEVDDEYFVSNKLAAEAVVWSGCGQDVNLRVNTAVRVRTNMYGHQALASLDSIDVSSGLIYHVQWRTCR